MRFVGVGFLLLALVGFGVPAEAADQRPCVSLREYRGTPKGMDPDTITRRWLEARWEVRGHRHAPATDENILAVVYRACGYGPNEAGVTVLYRKFRYRGVNHSLLGTKRWVKPYAEGKAPERQ